MKFMKVLPFLMVSGLSLVGCDSNSEIENAKKSGSLSNSEVENAKKSGFLNVGITIYEPMDYYAEDGETITGFDAELANAFANTLDIETRFIPIKWDSKILELNSKKIDLIWNGMTITDELKENIDLTIPYATNYQCVVTKSTNISSYQNADYIKDKKVAVESGSAGEEAASGCTKVNKVTSQEAALLEVKAGTSDCAIIDVTMANSVVGKGDFTDLATVNASLIAFEKEDFGVGARKNSDLTEKLNTFFKDSYKSGLLKELSTKYNVALNEETLK